jgi:chromosomal replication initiator protein
MSDDPCDDWSAAIAPRPPLIAFIQREVADHFCVNRIEMVSRRQAREVCRPRQVAMYLAKQMTVRSLPEIGRRFGGRDHTTVIHAIRQIEKLRLSDRELDADVRALSHRISGAA